MSEYLERMPALFFGHGSPMNALGGGHTAAWRTLGERLPRPKAILCISAHWFVPETAITATEHPRTIHDFYGFPKPLYDIDYPAPGDPWLVERVTDLLAPLTPVRADHDWGLDHGSWSVLMHAYPDASVPVLQLSIDRSKPPAFHYEVGRLLAQLRDEAVLIAASGDVVHNLRAMHDGAPYDWAIRFNELVKTCVLTRDHAPLLAYADNPDGRLAVPTPEHYLPLLYVLGTQGEDEPVAFFNDVIDLGAVSMLGIVIGGG